MLCITALNREDQKLAPKLVFDTLERKILQHYFKNMPRAITLQDYILRLAKLGGYLNRKKDPLPGVTVIWRELNKLSESRGSL